MDIAVLSELLAKVKNGGAKVRLAVASAGDEHTLDSVVMAVKENIVAPVLFGNREDILRILDQLGAEPDQYEIHDAESPAEAAAKAVSYVADGGADVLMKGMMDTSVLLRAVVNKEKGLGAGRLMNVFKLMEVPGYHKLLSIVDGGMVPYPTLEQKKDIILNCVEAMHALGYEEPKVGVLACIEKVNPKMPATVEGAQLAEMNKNGEIPGCIVEGPISYDCAMSREVADLKGYRSRISGDADILLGPDIHAVNIVSKALTITCHAKCAAYVVGAKCPIVMSSRGAEPEEKFYSIVLAVAAAMNR